MFLRFFRRLDPKRKVSPQGGASALLDESLQQLRARRQQVAPEDVEYQESSAIAQLNQEEQSILARVLQRVDPQKEVAPQVADGNSYVDPYWDPFNSVNLVKAQLNAEFGEYSTYVAVADKKKARLQIRRSLQRFFKKYDPFAWGTRQSMGPPLPRNRHDSFWERSPLRERLSRVSLTWRDVDVLQHCISESGFILPRRVTQFSRKQQGDLIKAVKTAQRMAVLPYDHRPPDYNVMPLMDPLQFLVHRLVDRVHHGCRRSRSMLEVMSTSYPDLDYSGFWRLLAEEGAAHGEPDGFQQELMRQRIERSLKVGTQGPP